jgi:hypothetical protein
LRSNDQSDTLRISIFEEPLMTTSKARAIATARKKGAPERTAKGMMFRFRDADTRFGVSRATTARLAQHLGLTETEVIHFAIAQLAKEQLPAYAPDDGALTKSQLSRIKKLEPQGRLRADQSLF